MLRVVFFVFLGCTVASRGGYQMARGRHYAKLSLSNAARLSFSDLCILLFMFLSLCRLCVYVFLCSHWSLVDVPLIFFCPADHVPDWQPRVLLGMVEARSVNVKKTTTTTTLLDLLSILQSEGKIVPFANGPKVYPWFPGFLYSACFLLAVCSGFARAQRASSGSTGWL